MLFMVIISQLGVPDSLTENPQINKLPKIVGQLEWNYHVFFAGETN
jgi:hypothetical protein